MKQGVEQQLEGGRGPQAVEQLKDVRFRQEPFAPIEGLRRETEDSSEPCPARGGASLLPTDPRAWLVPNGGPDFLREESQAPYSLIPTPQAHTHCGLGSDERSQHAATRGPGGAEGDTQVAASQGQAVRPLLCLFSHLSRLIL